MTKKTIVILCAVISLMFCFISVGYAALTATLSVSGSATVEPMVFDTLVITDVAAVSGNVTSESSGRVIPTNVRSQFTGSAGQTVTYKITVHNYSESETFIYAGASVSDAYADVSSKLSVSASKDAGNTDVLGNNLSADVIIGTPIAPGEEFVFYATYTLTSDLSGDEIIINYKFKAVKYTVTYLNNNELYAVDCIVNNSIPYSVRSDYPDGGGYSFAGWVNANATRVESYPKDNTASYTLTAKWENVYLIIFVEADGTVIYEENFTESSTGLSAAGQAIVDQKLAELNNEAAAQHMTVSWSSYDIANATSDITVRAVYNYGGILGIVPVYGGDGIVDHYEVQAVDDNLPEEIVVPGYVGGLPVKIVQRITNVAGSSDWNNYERNIKRIVIGEGVEELAHNSLSYTPNLVEVQLPSTLKKMGKNTFSRNDLFGMDKKTLTIVYNGTVAEWNAVVAASDSNWDGGLKNGSTVKCLDGTLVLSRSGWNLQ